MNDSCVDCGYKFKEDDGMYNFLDGVKCNDCGSKDHRTLRNRHKYEKNLDVKSQLIDIDGHDIDLKLLLDYAEKVEDTRRALEFSHGRANPLRIQKSLEERERIHKLIMDSLNIAYNSNKSFPVTGAINEWIKKTQTKVVRND